MDFNTFNCMFPQSVLPIGIENIWDVPYSGQVRLTSQSNTTINSFGRLEVYQNGQWGTVCNKGFTQEGADSACRQLGYTGAVYSGNAL